MRFLRLVSIHAPVMDAKMTIPLNRETFEVSIHAPVMDAKVCAYLIVVHQSFNPRARDGRELIGVICYE